jgi:hypothetical protein
MSERPINFVIATHGGLYLVVLDREFQIVRSQLIDDGYHYGVTVDVASNQESSTIYAYRGGPGREDVLPKEIRVWNFDGQDVSAGERIALYEEAGDIHQITRHGVGGFLLSNSRGNSIDRWDPAQGLLDRIHINGFDTDVNHINSVYPVGDLVAVMLHNFRKLESEIVLLKDTGDSLTELGRFSLKDWCCHNIGVIGHHLFFNASSARAIVKIDLRTLGEIKRVRLDAHTKGLSFDGKYIFSGTSDCAGRAERVRSCGWLNVVDPESLELVKKVQLTEPSRGTAFGNVNEIRLLNAADSFDVASNVDAEALAKSVDVEQSYVAIHCRRTWIRTLDRVRRTIGSVLSR